MKIASQTDYSHLKHWTGKVRKSWEAEVKALRRSKSYKKIWNHVRGILDEAWVQEDILKFRKKYGIPVNGLPTELLRIEDIVETLGALDSKRYISTFTDKYVLRMFHDDIAMIISKLGLETEHWSDTIAQYAIYGILEEPISPKLVMQSRFTNLQEELGESEGIDDVSQTVLGMRNKFSPFAIRLSPYVTENELIEYIRLFFKKDIEPMLKKFRVAQIRIGKYRTRANVLRDNIIADTMKLKRSAVQKLIKTKTGQNIDLKYISVLRRRVGKSNTK